MHVDSPSELPDGSWSVAVHGARPSELVRAFDPALPYVVIEGHSPAQPGWHRLPIALTDKGESIRTRTVRRIRFDICVSPREAIEAGPELDNSDQGWLYAWQVPTEPPEYLVLSDKEGRSRRAAMDGIGVTLLIDLPHRGETAIVWSSSRDVLDSAVERLHRQE
ncbi:hypothetical protein ACFYUD_36025 [Nocardia tengchongensis]|uniref:hypothetical protein n=1 Tax=Nocardia tengchongensis TaxID=2055889 RepID=UPI0036AB0427